jgi:hypothetical protein
MYPPLAQTYAAVPRPIKEVLAQQPLYVVEYARLAGWMEAVTSIIDCYLIDLEAPRISADIFALLYYADACLTGVR